MWTASQLLQEREGWVIRIESEEGSVGWGEVAPMPQFGTETVEEDAEALQTFGERIDPADLASVPERLTCLRAGLCAAFAEVLSKAAGTAAIALTGATAGTASIGARMMGIEEAAGADLSVAPSAAIDTLPNALAVAALLPAGIPSIEVAAAKAEAGFRVFKWKVGVGDIGDELGVLDDLLAALPSGSKVRLDANGAWDRRGAQRWLERCAERPIEFVEQPVAADRKDAEDLLWGLSGDYPTPLALDESLVRAGDAERWLGAGWPGVFVLKLSLLGDSSEVLRRLSVAKARVVFSSALETAVGARAGLRQAFEWTGPRLALGYGVWPLFADSRFDGPYSAPFIRRSDVDRIDPEALWTALS